MNSEIIRLQSATNDLIIRTGPRTEILYWGAHLNYFNPADVTSLLRPVPNSRLDVDVPLTLAAENGRGLFSSTGIEGHHRRHDAFPIFTTVKVQHTGNQLIIDAIDTTAGLRFTTEIKLDPQTGILQIRNGVTNLKTEPYELQRLAVTLPISGYASEVMAFHGRWLQEFLPHRVTLEHGSYCQENRRGRTSHEYFPAQILGESGFNETRGQLWALHLGWSGNHRIRSEVKSDGRRFIQAEALYFPGEIELGENETQWTPWAYATYSANGLNTMSQHYHQFVREQLIHFASEKKRPVHLNTWEGIYFDHNPEYIMEMATKAAAMGVERFIIDDGWFIGRNNDQAALGDWYLDENKYPHGLMPVIEHVKAQGMEFGIWFEPEMINKNSRLYELHPDWLLELDGYQQPSARYQYVLDLSNPDVFEYLLARVSAILSEYPVDYVKWDMNRPLVQPCHNGIAHANEQTLRFYALLDALQERFPQTEFESCSSGGGRIDYEVLKRSQRFWASDNNDALERQRIQKGMSYFFPLEVTGAHIGSARCHATMRQHSFSFRGITALFGHMGVELDPVSATAEELAGYQHYIQLHKRFRPLLHSGNYWRVELSDPSIQAQGVVNTEQSEALFAVAQIAMPSYALAGNLKLPGLNPQAIYQLTLLDPAQMKRVEEGGHTMRQLPSWIEQPITATGEWLEKAGIALPILDPESAILLHLKQI